MRKYATNASSELRLAYGQELIIGLRVIDDTAPLADALQEVQETLETRLDERLAADATLTRARVALRFADYTLDRMIRGVRRHAELLDGGRVGPLTTAVFPDGLVAETVPTGERQERRARALLARVHELGTANAETLRAQMLEPLAAAVETFAKSRASYDAAFEDVETRFARERLARDAHRLQVERTMAHVRALFPDDPSMRELFFPDVSRSSRAKDEPPVEEA
jgi:hypothetical protein